MQKKKKSSFDENKIFSGCKSHNGGRVESNCPLDWWECRNKKKTKRMSSILG